MSGIAPKQNAFKFKIAPHKQKSIEKKKIDRKIAPLPLTNGSLCLSTPNYNGKSGTVYMIICLLSSVLMIVEYKNPLF
jgi:hypothetical protein